MWTDTAEEWRRLREHYSALWDEELIALSADAADLTEIAQQLLRDEMKKRGLDKQRAEQPEEEQGTNRASRRGTLHWEGEDSSKNLEDREEETGQPRKCSCPREYSWKVLLCECKEREEAWQLARALEEAGIDCWIDGPRTQNSQDTRYPRVLVAADQLDRARLIAAQPIPQSIIDESKVEAPEFELPRCPRCRAADPLLESVDPTNSWHCESCGFDWEDRVDDLDISSPK